MDNGLLFVVIEQEMNKLHRLLWRFDFGSRPKSWEKWMASPPENWWQQLDRQQLSYVSDERHTIALCQPVLDLFGNTPENDIILQRASFLWQNPQNGCSQRI